MGFAAGPPGTDPPRGRPADVAPRLLSLGRGLVYFLVGDSKISNMGEHASTETHTRVGLGLSGEFQAIRLGSV